MKELNLDETKRIQLEVLEAVHNFCVDNKLTYVLYYGTLLGAIRHKGSIPWDDDIDIAMPRKDYEYFLSHFDDEKYGVLSWHNHKKYFYPWAKAYSKNTLKIEDNELPKSVKLGIDVDIFPLDEYESREAYLKKRNRHKWFFFKYKFSTISLKPWHGPLRVFGEIVKFFNKPFLHRHAKKADKMFLKNKNEFNCYVLSGLYENPKIFIYNKHVFDNPILLVFEDKKFYGPENYDECLKDCYGDYMKLPPKEKQVIHHSYKAYLLD